MNFIVENLQVAENTPTIVLASGVIHDMLSDEMATKKPKTPAKLSFTPTEKDYKIILAGKEKHGANITGVIRMALRRFAESEGIQVAS